MQGDRKSFFYPSFPRIRTAKKVTCARHASVDRESICPGANDERSLFRPFGSEAPTSCTGCFRDPVHEQDDDYTYMYVLAFPQIVGSLTTAKPNAKSAISDWRCYFQLHTYHTDATTMHVG